MCVYVHLVLEVGGVPDRGDPFKRDSAIECLSWGPSFCEPPMFLVLLDRNVNLLGPIHVIPVLESRHNL